MNKPGVIPPDVSSVVGMFPVPRGLEDALRSHQHSWLWRMGWRGASPAADALQIERELADTAVRSAMRGYFVQDFAYLVASAHYQGKPARGATVVRADGATDLARLQAMLLIERWLEDGGAALLPARVSLGGESSDRALLQKQKYTVRRGILEAVDDALVWSRPRPSTLQARAAQLIDDLGRTSWKIRGRQQSLNENAQTSFEVMIRQARLQRRGRTGAASGSRRARSAEEFSVQTFRKTVLFQRLGGLFPPLFRGVDSPAAERASAPAPAEKAVAAWFAREALPKPSRTRLKTNNVPSSAFPISDSLWSLISPHLSSRRHGIPARKVVSAILTVAHARIPWAALPTKLGLGSGMTALRHLRDWQRSGSWRHVSTVLSRDPTTAAIDLAALGARSCR